MSQETMVAGYWWWGQQIVTPGRLLSPAVRYICDPCRNGVHMLCSGCDCPRCK